jgi:hypothetical protein
VLAVAAAALSAAQGPNAVADKEQTTAAHAEGNAAENVTAANDETAESAERLKYEAQCDPGDDKRYSDLCAQWKAADAAVDSAWWAARATWVGAVSGVLVLIALGFAFEANWISRDTAKRQLRAYVVARGIRLQVFEVGKPIKARITFFNCGQTPALELRSSFVPNFGPVGETKPLAMPEGDAFGTLGAGAKGYGLILDDTALTQKAADAIVSGTPQNPRDRIPLQTRHWRRS